MFKEITNTIKKYNSFIITSHVSPDGDALGSSIALGLALKKLGKKVIYNIDPSLGDKLSFLTDITQLSPNKNINKYDVAICLDCSDINHLYDSNSIKHGEQIINIDHHINNHRYGSINFIDSKAGATGEIIYDLIKQLGVDVDKDMAIALYTAIVTDTGGFKYSNTTSRTHLITSELLKLPISPWKINKKLFDEHSKSKIFLIGKAMNSLRLYFNGKLALIQINLNDLEEVGATPGDIEGIINYGRDIIGVEVAVLIKENKPGEYKVGFRSNEYIDVGEIALSLGGGGHIRASGCTMRGNIDDIIEQLKEIISKKL